MICTAPSTPSVVYFSNSNNRSVSTYNFSSSLLLIQTMLWLSQGLFMDCYANYCCSCKPLEGYDCRLDCSVQCLFSYHIPGDTICIIWKSCTNYAKMCWIGILISMVSICNSSIVLPTSRSRDGCFIHYLALPLTVLSTRSHSQSWLSLIMCVGCMFSAAGLSHSHFICWHET